MAIFKCKMCGGDLEVEEGINIAECEYCGTKQTVPNADNEKKVNLFNRANRLRLASEFDKAAGIYENIIAEFPEEAEAYWGLCLCDYGIEYVDDPATAKKIPTCHRASFERLSEDENFKLAIEYSDVVAQKVYRDEAREIDRIMQDILSISKNEKPYDVFICYKETDEKGERTVDSVLAQDIYDALTNKGLKVFFSRITLEDKLGRQYEPYIFAALNSAKVMLAIGTKYEYYHAVWVKNEWSRFLKLMAKDKSKVLIPCFKDMDAYDIPEEFKGLQAQDMGKLGFMQDIVRGVQKLMSTAAPAVSESVSPAAVNVNGVNITTLLDRGQMALEDKNWNEAKKHFDKVLDANSKCAEAYLGFAMIEKEASNLEELFAYGIPENKNYQRAKQFADEILKGQLDNFEQKTKQLQDEERIRKEEERIKKIKPLKGIREKLSVAKNIISAGWEHTVGLKSDGTVVAVGKNGYGHRQCDVSDWRDIVAVSAGGWHTVGLKSDGTVVAVGYNKDGQCDVPDWKDIVAVSVGSDHMVGLKSDGTIVAVGRNDEGQCNVSDWKDIVAVSAGYDHTVGLKSDGTVVAVGFKYNLQCNVSDWKDIVAVSVGSGHTVGLKLDGTVVAVGSNKFGQCDVSNWEDIVAVSAGGCHTVGLKSDGTVIAIGMNDYRQCNVSDWKDIVAVSVGFDHTVGLKSDGTVVAVGRNDNGQRNVSDWRLFKDFNNIEQERIDAAEEARIRKEKQFEEEKIKKEERIKQLKEIREKLSVAKNIISAGYYHTVGLKLDGTVVAVGSNYCEQYNVSGWEDTVAISAGGGHTVGLKLDGTVVAVGYNIDGRCNVSNWKDIVAVSAGGCHTVGLKSNGTVVAVGLNDDGRCIVSNWEDTVAISAGGGHTVGLKSDGTVVAVGENDNGQCNVSDWEDIVAVSAGGCHTVGLKSNGTVVAVGLNDDGRCNVSGWEDIVAVSAGGGHTVGLKSDGTVVAVGWNDDGQCNVFDWKNIVAVSTGGRHTVGLKSDGTVVAVGNNEDGQCNVSGWRLFKDFNNIKQERIDAVTKRKSIIVKITTLEKEKKELENELSNLTGIFKGKRRKEIEARLAEIDEELENVTYELKQLN